MYGVDANKDGKKDPYNPVDAIFAAARYLKAAGYEKDVRRSIFAYNHADWYVDSVMLRARLIAGVPADLVGSLTGLTEGRFPSPPAPATPTTSRRRRPPSASSGARTPRNVIESNDDRRSVEIFAQKGSPVVATNDGEIKKIGSQREARPLHRAPGRLRQPLHVLRPRLDRQVLPGAQGGRVRPEEAPRKAIKANDDADDQAHGARVGRPPARPRRLRRRKPARQEDGRRRRRRPRSPSRSACSPTPTCPLSREPAGSSSCSTRRRAKGGFETYRNYFSRPFGGDSKDVRLRRLKVGSRVIGGTILGRVGGAPRDQGLASRLLDPPGGQGRAADRPEADPRRLEAARGHRDLPRLRPQRPLRRRGLRRLLDRPDPAAAQAAAREARALRHAHRDLRRAAARTSSPARSTGACWPRSPTWPSPGSSPPSRR